MLLLTSAELWALERRTDLELAPALNELQVADRGKEFDEVALLGLVCRGPAAADIYENIVMHPTTSTMLELLVDASEGFNTLSFNNEQLGSTRYLAAVGGLVSIEKGANDIYGFQAIATEADLPTFIAGSIVSSMTIEGSGISDVVVSRTDATDESPLAGLRKTPDGSLVVEPSGQSVESLEDAVSLVSAAIAEL